MLIAFEGADNVGRSSAADKLSGGHAIKYADKESYEEAQELAKTTKGITQCFDRIGWLSHLVYSMALPEFQEQYLPKFGVFAMPDVHLVFKIYKPGYEPMLEPGDGLESDTPAIVNQTYRSFAHTFMALNEARGYSLFKTVSIMEVFTEPLSGAVQQKLVEYSTPLHPWWGTRQTQLVRDELGLYDLLLTEDSAR